LPKTELNCELDRPRNKRSWEVKAKPGELETTEGLGTSPTGSAQLEEDDGDDEAVRDI